ncbi:transcription antitermination factor NusB [Romboutsia weinsteinii]|uniref:Transcription antitermination protein NusB n=1 Tax=Romboutsia weinsteinii TaxID=2020949 RepID=A0A371J7H2_9FIRM|nr:transcription antitermination factor NusB [Romboutsia weinsteinii]RDY28730.1 transcription antitermination factor NusB [Romboutsia weinsteinii]
MKKDDKARKITTREYMMKLIYQANVTKEEPGNLKAMVEDFVNDNFEYISNRYEELRLQYSNNPNMSLENLQIEDTIDKEYIDSICVALDENGSKIDELINKYAKNWSVNRMPKVDLSILRLAICEILYAQNIPTKVSINEAVEMAKVYCDDKSPKFINGILGSVVNEFGER